MDYYRLFNYVEGTLWLIAAITLRKIIPIKKKQHSTACYIATVGFLIFSISDFLEGSLTRELHLWLWILKISCGVIFMIARIHYIGRKKFKLTDRYFIFFALCLSAAIAVLFLTSKTSS